VRPNSASSLPISQHELAKANGKRDVTVSANYSHVNALNAFTVAASIPLPIFDRNQGEIARTSIAISQAQQQAAARGQVLTDVKDAYEALQTSDRVAQYFRSTHHTINLSPIPSGFWRYLCSMEASLSRKYCNGTPTYQTSALFRTLHD
jgi:hypothetical protein